MKITPFLRSVCAPIILGAFAACVTVSCSPQSDTGTQAIPVTAAFGEGTPGPNEGPYAVTLTNTSQDALTVTATIVWSVTSHNRDTQTVLPPHEIAAGGSWTINDFAAQDRIIVAAAGFEPLEFTTPAGK